TSLPPSRRRKGGGAERATDPPTTISAVALRDAAERAFAGDSKAGAPRKQIVKGLELFATRSSTSLATDAAGGFEISTTCFVRSSASSASIAIKVVIAPTSALRSRPPVPIAWLMPRPARAIRHDTS